MTRFVMRVPDLGEGSVSAEVIAWKVAAGDTVREDAPLVEMSTDKAVVEVPSPVSGLVVSVSGKPGDTLAVGSELAVFELESTLERSGVQNAAPSARPAPTAPAAPPVAAAAPASATQETPLLPARVMASPATRRRASEIGLDLARMQGTGPGGRIVEADLERAQRGTPGITEIPVIGVRRVIAQRMAEAKRNAPHFAYVEEVDVTDLEALRVRLNAARKAAGGVSLTYLPFIARALSDALAGFPQCNAQYDAARNVLLRHAAVHLGIATQTPDGLKVPVVRDVARRGLDDLATEIRRVTEAARSGRARREELGGSTITLTSLGKLGGIVSTPILNAPEVAIIGINKAVERVVVHHGEIAIRRIMNLSSSFDHRFVDGYDAAALVQALKARLETPQDIFGDLLT
ncbi:MAG: dihydrolipoamide acetyltransferase family protein [Proteobacteria bacterium]|nr:dihydrolipoamide acetyltransferase family protein [Pseudomonadota bacterium]